MRPRAVGGLEPDDADQRELVELWHLSRTALAGTSPDRGARIDWVVGAFLAEHPGIARKWVYVWCADHLGLLLDHANAVPADEHASHVPKRTRRR